MHTNKSVSYPASLLADIVNILKIKEETYRDTYFNRTSI